MSNFKKKPTTAQDILEQSLWLNKYIEINNETIKYCIEQYPVTNG